MNPPQQGAPPLAVLFFVTQVFLQEQTRQEFPPKFYPTRSALGAVASQLVHTLPSEPLAVFVSALLV